MPTGKQTEPKPTPPANPFCDKNATDTASRLKCALAFIADVVTDVDLETLEKHARSGLAYTFYGLEEAASFLCEQIVNERRAQEGRQ